MLTLQLVVLPAAPSATVQIGTPAPHTAQAPPQVAFADAARTILANGLNVATQVPGPLQFNAVDGLVDITLPPVLITTSILAESQPAGGDGLK